MAITKLAGRQEVVNAYISGTFGGSGGVADMTAEGAYPVVDVPAGAIVVGGFFSITDATSANVDVHLGETGGTVNRYLDNVDGAATGLTALTITGYTYTAADTLDFLIDTAAPAAAGVWELSVDYIVEGRAAFSQG